MKSNRSAAWAIAVVLFGTASLAAATNRNYTDVALPTTDCSAYPLYNATDDTAGPWILVADGTGNSSVNGHGDTTAYSTEYMPAFWGQLVILQDNTYAKAALRCANGTLQTWVPQYISYCVPYCTGPPTSPSDTQPPAWEPVVTTPFTGGLFFHSELSSPALPYAHVVHGSQTKKVFIGGPHGSLWAFSAGTNSRGQAVYYLRNLGPDDALLTGEFTGFLKIDA